MQMYKNELVIYRGEAFTLDYAIQFANGAPFIISNELNNPYFLLSISNTAFSQNSREVRNYWLSLENYKKFTLTEPLDLQSLKVSATSNESVYKSFNDITSFPITGVYLNGKLVSSISENHAVFYNSLEPGKYKYWSEDKWVDYECRVVCPFVSGDTKTWSAQKYYYTIQLVTGIDMREYLVTQYSELHPESYQQIGDLDNIELYNSLKKDVVFPEDFDVTQPLAITSDSIPILSPTSIKVISYMQGDVTW